MNWTYFIVYINTNGLDTSSQNWGLHDNISNLHYNTYEKRVNNNHMLVKPAWISYIIVYMSKNLFCLGIQVMPSFPKVKSECQ